ncbi:MAG TPA: tetratricopeptide repeat protein [Thermoanaerobaculia bacterium]|jgi:tetratricopeptide (TPR) repeat protein
MHLGAEGIAALLETGLEGELAHLLACPRCRRRLASVLDEPVLEEAGGAAGELRPPAPGDGRSTALVDRVLARALEIHHLEQRRSLADVHQTYGLYAELLNVPPQARREVLEADARFRSPDLAELLLAAADEAAADDPLRSHHLAGLAMAVLERVAATARLRRLQAVAYCALAEADRRRGRVDTAEDLLKAAMDELRNDPILTEARARLCRTLAAVRQDQGRLDEALGLFARARAMAEELAADDELAKAGLAEGWLLLAEDEPDAAVPRLREAFNLTAVEREPYQTLSALHGLALAYAEQAREDVLPTLYAFLDAMGEYLVKPLDEVRVRWVRSQVDWRLGERDRALAGLAEVFQRFVAAGLAVEAATAGLELARRRLESGVSPAAAEPLEEIARALAPLAPGKLPAHLAAVVEFALLFPRRGQSGYYMDVLSSATAYVERAQFNSRLPFFPLSDPDLVLAWTELAPAQRQKAAAAAGVALEEGGEPLKAGDLARIAWTHEALTGVRILVPDEPGPEDDDMAAF